LLRLVVAAHEAQPQSFDGLRLYGCRAARRGDSLCALRPGHEIPPVEAGQRVEDLALADSGRCAGICCGVDGGPRLVEQRVRLRRTAAKNGEVAADSVAPGTGGEGFEGIERSHSPGQLARAHHGVHRLNQQGFAVLGLRIQARCLGIGLGGGAPGAR
jgi:hypothetical protein